MHRILHRCGNRMKFKSPIELGTGCDRGLIRWNDTCVQKDTFWIIYELFARYMFGKLEKNCYRWLKIRSSEELSFKKLPRLVNIIDIIIIIIIIERNEERFDRLEYPRDSEKGEEGGEKKEERFRRERFKVKHTNGVESSGGPLCLEPSPQESRSSAPRGLIIQLFAWILNSIKLHRPL